MNKRKFVLTFLLLAILSAFAYFAIYENEKESTLNIQDTAFSVQDTASISKIFIASKNGSEAKLEKMGNGEWMLNDKFKVNRMQLSILLKTLYWQRIKRPVHKGERDMVIKNIATSGSKVEIYQNGTKSKVFYVGDDTNDSKGTYFIMEGSENPFVVYMPNHTGFLSPRYVVKERNYRNTQIFKSNLKTFKSIKIDYPASPAQSFIIQNIDGSANILGVDKFDQVKLNNYISGFQRVHVTKFLENEDSKAELDSLRRFPPNVKIAVDDEISMYSNEISLYFLKDDPDSYLGIATFEGDEKYVVVQQYIFNKLIQPLDFFTENEIKPLQ